MTLLAVSARPAEYFVCAHAGDNAADGRTRSTAFRTIQRGLDALDAGDTLTLLPGEYREAASREGLGDSEVETLIRAAIPGTVILRGDVPAPEFRKVEGFQFIYVGDFDLDAPVQVVNELDTLTVFQGRPSVTDLEFTPGTFHHDREAGKLYLSSSDRRPPETHAYSVSVIRANGLELTGARRVVIEGLAATGFNTAGHAQARNAFLAGIGIVLLDSNDCVIRDAWAWLNGMGVQINSRDENSGGNRIERAVAWANDTPYAGFRTAGITGFAPRGDEIRDSEAFFNAFTGIYFRGASDPELTSRLTRNLAWNNRWDLLIKGNPERINVMDRCIGRFYSTRENARDGLYFTRKRNDVEDAPGTIVLDEVDNLDMEAEFADPLNRDYRLQANSRFRRAGEDGTDLGPSPYQANIFYISPNGSDTQDGLSRETAWRSLSRAIGLRFLRPGDTVYLEAGEYDAPRQFRAGGEASDSILIRARGGDTVVIRGELTVTESSGVRFERLHFPDGVTVTDSRDIAFAHCFFNAPQTALAARDVSGLQVSHSQFTGFAQAALSLAKSPGAHLSGNLYDNRNSPAIRADALSVETLAYADYNAFRAVAAAWAVDSATPIAPPSPRTETYSREMPETFEPEPVFAGFHHRPGFAALGPMGKPFGPYRLEPRREKLRLTSEPALHSVSTTTANIEWSSYLPSRVHVAWGETPETAHTDVFDTEYFGSYSLTGLEPGRTYYFRILALSETGRRPASQHTPTRLGTIEVIPAKVDAPVLAFTTLDADPVPATYYVAPDGDDQAAGLSRETAWRTLQQAANRVAPGDTVLLAGGTYEEQVHLRTTGTPDGPITFRCLPGETVILSALGYELDDAFIVDGKHHLRFDGLFLLSMQFNLYRANHIDISRVFAGSLGRGYSPGLITAHHCQDLRIRNCVMLSAKSGPAFYGCNDVRIENSVFFRNMISQVTFCHLPGAPITLSRNIFTDGLSSKYNAAMISLARHDAFTERDNCFYPRRDPETKNIILLYSDEAFERCRTAFDMGDVPHPHPVIESLTRLNFAAMQATFGESGSLIANPKFAGAAEFPEHTDDGTPIYPPDRISGGGPTPFNRFFATHPELIERDIGLQRHAFEDFQFD